MIELFSKQLYCTHLLYREYGYNMRRKYTANLPLPQNDKSLEVVAEIDV
ncbi:hypothetical protein [Porphyromonas sp. COT-290 OH860]|nr:hypothetical protein [Porphyromonas sp. COT-290 OH860]